jgi:hypothetical protein
VLHDCHVVDEEVLVALFKAGGPLQVLELGKAATLTDAGVLAICRGCRGLRRLRLEGCRQVSTVGVVAVLTTLSELRSLHLEGCAYLLREVRHWAAGQQAAGLLGKWRFSTVISAPIRELCKVIFER